ncbi:MAG: hypothetical protein JWR19_792 [Pedosphaera sp.]|nr:hypothetical protein [Pedosphaera sp.]
MENVSQWFAAMKINDHDPEPLTSSRRVIESYAEICRSTQFGARFGAQFEPVGSNSLLHQQFGMEPMVGIEPTTYGFAARSRR